MSAPARNSPRGPQVVPAGRRGGAASRPRVFLPLLLLTALVGVLLLHGYVHGDFAADHRVHPPVSADRVPDEVLSGGPVVDARGSPVRSHRMPAGTVALTFDDGPDPTWTPRILDVLDRYGAKGTFFVTGSSAARHPGLVRQLVASGHEIGVHTFTHPDLGYQSQARLDRELAQTQLALAGAAGVHSTLVRPPYSSEAADLDNRSWPVVRRLGAKGYVTAFVDVDGEDWRRPGAHAIADRVTRPLTGRGAVVLLHDSGGDRSQTVRALERIIPALTDRGYRFTTITGALGADSAQHRVHGTQLWSGRIFVVAVVTGERLVPPLALLLAAVGGLVLARLVVMPFLARRHAGVRAGPRFRWGPEVTEPVSVVIPAYNERECITQTVLSVVRSTHPVEVVVVDDGSTDGTADIVRSLALPAVTVVRQPNAGKAAALNTGVARASHELIVMMDGDTVFEPDTVHRLVQPFSRPVVGAVAGNTKVANRGRLLGTWQHLEYVMGLNLDRRMYDLLHCIPTVPGAVGAFRRTALRHTGGVSADTLAEDTDLTMALHRGGWDVVYEERARGWTEAPATLGQLWRQRYRWSYGTLQAMWKHRHAVVERGHAGHFGRYGLALVALFTVLTPLLSPLIDLFLLYGLLFQDPRRTLLAWGGLLAVQLLCAAYALRLDGERLRVLWALPLQQLVYRQLLYLVLLQSCVTAVTGAGLRWHKLRRTGRVTAPAAPRPLPAPPPALPPPAGPPSVPRRPRAPAEPEQPKKGGRDLYLDLLRALALVRVVAYHTFNWAWLTLVFPAMGVMFALAGSLMARSLDRHDRTSAAVVRARMRRLLPPLWAFAACVVGVMLGRGWNPGEDGRGLRGWAELLWWIVPLHDPPTDGSAWALQVAAPLWYIRAYLLFVLLSPLLLRVFRKGPWTCVAGFLVLAEIAQTGLVPMPGALRGPVTDLVVFGACWLLGFAHRDGLIHRLPAARVGALAVLTTAIGGWFAFTRPTDEGYDLGEIPLAQALWSFGFVLVLMRFRPRGDTWVRRYRAVHAAVVLLNARAVTVYLWHEVALVLGVLLIDRMWRVHALETTLPLAADWFLFLLAWPLIGGAVLLTGWVEDVAARRRPRPWPRPAPRA
ncbi:peptidoglycan/xylan/chitin deacetylase (PgdA/CDA1 family)/glycosyltransferase involved in cell wall biosynthesis/peptidoglycan/LPS O-acetylase OafA/YrhL [Streptomyces sp. SAI-135]|nr:peptidoglycan/xylan/chitin deacetylase (PgdA/CDA1 family)/glycosyltransferase involved in cell wall biosynthesis/peptidoglycan/LPS O-acetylase OafA/YrhL [Streptomyces sp. SAI-090]MDH6621051.1 peptidoglycan/xylan/chitin deacetylase (PgdA/CDA1 family)/glycosyltransferase involved in cell wall biosynthesis/peptidoglycan/LPS O-acetylase OafA/YrhL [Streptomyces sp. SAI-135]